MVDLTDISNRSSIIVIALSILMIFMSGIFFGITYFALEATEAGFLENDCVINNNVYVDSCQELWEWTLLPFLALRYILIYASYFFIFGNVFAMLVIGYRSGKSPAMAGLLVFVISLFTYASIMISNIYRRMLEVSLFNDIMLPFTVYNKIMLYYPWFIFILSLASVMLAIVNWQRTRVNQVEDQNY